MLELESAGTVIFLGSFCLWILHICWGIKTFSDKGGIYSILSLCFFFLNKKIYYLFIYLIYFWLCWLLVEARGFLSSCVMRVFSLSSCGTQAPDRVGSVVCGTWALSLRHMSSGVVARGLSCPAACGILVPWPGIEPASPALEGGFFTTGPRGKSLLSLWIPNFFQALHFHQ